MFHKFSSSEATPSFGERKAILMIPWAYEVLCALNMISDVVPWKGMNERCSGWQFRLWWWHLSLLRGGVYLMAINKPQHRELFTKFEFVASSDLIYEANLNVSVLFSRKSALHASSWGFKKKHFLIRKFRLNAANFQFKTFSSLVSCSNRFLQAEAKHHVVIKFLMVLVFGEATKKKLEVDA